MDKCPKCGCSLQQHQTLDQDDNVIKVVTKCKAKIPYKRTKGCGYSKTEYGPILPTQDEINRAKSYGEDI